MQPPNNRILQRVRHRIHLPAYDSEVRGAVVKKDLPFVVGILGAFYWAPPNPWPSLQTREFMEIDRENFNTVMASLGVRLHLRVPSGITSGNSDLECQLIFRSMQDFEPIGVIAQVEPLQQMLQKRGQLASRLVECQNNLSELAGSGDAILEECTSLCKELSLHVSMPSSDILEVLRECMAQIDASVSSQLTEILHHPEFQKLEGSWRGLQYLVMNSETDRQLKLKLLSVTKRDLIRDFEKVGEFDQTHLFKLLQNDVYCSTDGEPIGALIGDYEFTNDPADIQLLEDMSNIFAAAHCPFISSVSPDFFDLKRWSDLEQIKDVGSLVMGVRHTKWRAFRDSEDSVFVGLTLPCVLARMPNLRRNFPV